MKKILRVNKSELNEQAILEALTKDGIVIFKNFYSPEEITAFNIEFDRVFVENVGDISVLDAEDCSKDERIFHLERYSELIKEKFANNLFLTNIAAKYTNKPLKKVTMANRLEYTPEEIRNSGGGWHRDNHDLQFKAILYLSETTERNGNFQWITNSSQQLIGRPTPRTVSYDTRFNDSTIEDIILNEEKCELVNIVGPPGTVVFADTSYIHRGNIIEEGMRKTLTQYYLSK